jgi:hypothetical protein
MRKEKVKEVGLGTCKDEEEPIARTTCFCHQFVIGYYSCSKTDRILGPKAMADPINDSPREKKKGGRLMKGCFAHGLPGEQTIHTITYRAALQRWRVHKYDRERRSSPEASPARDRKVHRQR